MLFPKTKPKKKRMRHPASILHDKNSRTCYLCVMLHDNWNEHRILDEHHVFGGPNRKNSEEYGLKVYLCHAHHIYGPEAVHNMKRHKAEESDEKMQWSMWQTEMLKSLEKYKHDNKKKYGKQFKDINAKISGLIAAANIEGQMEQEKKILQAIRKGFPAKRATKGGTAEFFKLNDRKLEALIKATTDDMEKAETAVLRMANDQYRKVIYNAQVYANTGAATYETAVDMATKDFLKAGLNCIQYANGARHTIADYADMAIRTACKRAYLQGEGVKRQEWGVHTVIINKRGSGCPCPLCVPFVGKVMVDDVWSGGTRKEASETGYKLLSEAIAAGLYHPRCRDSHTTYFPGISTPPDGKFTKKELKRIEKKNKQESRQQYAERQVKQYVRLADFSLDPDNQEKYSQKANEWKNVANGTDTDIMISGARITDIFSKEADEFAEMYYKEIRSFSTDSKKIADNLGKDEADIRKIKAYLFEDDSLLDTETGRYRRFDPDCAIAQSWQRLMTGKDIKQHDRTLIEHELLEMKIKRENPDMEHWKAHQIASEKYDYPKEAMEYYGNLKKYKKDK